MANPSGDHRSPEAGPVNGYGRRRQIWSFTNANLAFVSQTQYIRRMSKTAYVTARVEPKLKASAENVLRRLGLSTTEAITMFLHQVTLRRGLPFEVRIPTETSRRAIEELEGGRGERFATADDLVKDALGRRRRRKA